MFPLHKNYKFNNLALNQGTNTKGQRYNRTPQATGGYAELVNIVAGLQKDVKRINQCLTLPGAQAYAAKRKNWQASELDFTGPEGKPDGINEVIVTDANGNIRVINGYTLGKTTYPERKLYRSMYPTKGERHQNKYGDFLNELYEIHDGLDSDGNLAYQNAIPDGAQFDQFRHIRPLLKIKDAFKKFLFQPVYEVNKQALKDAGMAPIDLAKVATKTLSHAYKTIVKDSILQTLLNVDDLSQIAPNTIRKLLKSDEYKNAEHDLVVGILSEDQRRQATMNTINEILQQVAQSLGQAGFNRSQIQDYGQAPQRSEIRQSQFNYNPNGNGGGQIQGDLRVDDL